MFTTSGRSVWLASVVALLTMIGAKASAGDEIVVSRSTPTTAIIGNEPAGGLRKPIALAPGSAWYFSELIVRKSLLDKMRAEGLLPIKHAWYRVSGDGLTMEKPDFIYELSVGDVSALPDLEREVFLRGGYYDWRTASCRRKLSQGTYRILVTDRIGRRIGCESNQCFTDVTVKSGGNPSAQC